MCTKKYWLRCRVIIPRVTTDSYAPKKAFKHNIVVTNILKIFLAHFQTVPLIHPKAFFKSNSWWILKVSSKVCKNEYHLTFSQIKNNSNAFRTHRWCVWISLIILNILTTYCVLIRRVTWKFFPTFSETPCWKTAN